MACALRGVDGEACDLDEDHAEISRRRVEACGVEVDAGDSGQQIDAQEAVGCAPWRSPWVIEEQIDNFKRLAHPGMTADAENGEAKP